MGGYQYYQHSKTSSAETFARCNALFDAAAEAPEKYLEAEACFDSTWDLGFVSDTMEVLRQNRVGEIQDKRNAQKDVLEDAKDALSLKDTAKAVEILRSYQGAMFLRNYDKDDWEKIAIDLNKRPVEGVTGEGILSPLTSHPSPRQKVLDLLAKYGIYNNKVVLWGTGTPLREFLWSEDMADASVHVLLNVNFSDIIGIEKYSSVHYGASTDGAVDRNHSAGRGGAIPKLGEIRNCHINVGTGKELTIRELSELVVKAVGFGGTVEFDASKPDGTMRKLIDVSKLHSLGWTHKVEIEEGVQKLFEWYRSSLV